MKRIRSRIMISMCALIVVSLLIVSIASIYLNIQTANGTLKQTMVKTAEIASKQFSNHLRVYKIIVEDAASDERVIKSSTPLTEKQALLEEIINKYSDFTRGNILGTDGISIFTGDNFSDREYFQKAMQGQTWVSDPVVSKITGTVTIIIAAPIWQDGIFGSRVTGVLYLIPIETFLNDAVSEIKISSGAGAQIINRQGTIIAHPNMDFVANESNSQENEKLGPALASIAMLEREMMAGKTGFGTYSMMGVKMFLGYAPIEDSNGWSIGVNAPLSDFMSYVNMSVIITVVLLAVAIAIALIASMRLANGIGKPLNALAGILSSITNTGRVDIGDAATEQVRFYSEKKDEIGTLAHSASCLIKMLESKVEILNAIANGDLTVDVACGSDDDVIGNALAKMVGNLNDMLLEIENKKNETIVALVNAEEAKDFYTRGHSLHVCLIILKFYERLPHDLRSKTSKTVLSAAAILHDIGKIGIPDTVLNKPAKLTEKEYDLIKKHPRYGAAILKNTDHKNIADIIYNHHERIDGNGYYSVPNDKIPLESKMIAIADTFSALTTNRIYRPHRSIDEAIYVIQEAAGTQFDSQLVNIFCSIGQIELEDTEKELELKLRECDMHRVNGVI